MTGPVVFDSNYKLVCLIFVFMLKAYGCSNILKVFFEMFDDFFIVFQILVTILSFCHLMRNLSKKSCRILFQVI